MHEFVDTEGMTTFRRISMAAQMFVEFADELCGIGRVGSLFEDGDWSCTGHRLRLSLNGTRSASSSSELGTAPELAKPTIARRGPYLGSPKILNRKYVIGPADGPVIMADW